MSWWRTTAVNKVCRVLITSNTCSCCLPLSKEVVLNCRIKPVVRTKWSSQCDLLGKVQVWWMVEFRFQNLIEKLQHTYCSQSVSFNKCCIALQEWVYGRTAAGVFKPGKLSMAHWQCIWRSSPIEKLTAWKTHAAVLRGKGKKL